MAGILAPPGARQDKNRWGPYTRKPVRGSTGPRPIPKKAARRCGLLVDGAGDRAERR
jgi:hypothetical protein